MIYPCPQCNKQLNLTANVGQFICPFCHVSCQINAYNPNSREMNSVQPAYSSPVYGSPGMVNSTYAPGMVQSMPSPGMVNSTYSPGMVQPTYSPGMVQPMSSPGMVQPMSSPGMVQPMSSPGMVQPMQYDQMSTASQVLSSQYYSSAQPAQTVESIFQTVTSNTGRMTVANLQAAMKGVNISLSSEICNQLFLRHDVDDSGFINLEEFRAIYDEINEWFKVFQRFDTDNSGKMEYEEFYSAMSALNYPLSNKVLKKFFDKIDNLHNRYIDLNGFIKAVSIVQIVQLDMDTVGMNYEGKVTLNMNGLMEIVNDLPL